MGLIPKDVRRREEAVEETEAGEVVVIAPQLLRRPT